MPELFLRSLGRFAPSCMLAAALLYPALSASSRAPILIDASAPSAPPAAANYHYDPAEARAPSGHTLGLNAQYLTLDGKPWLPVMGEIHYSRVPESEWETEILKMKSAGVQIIATYIIWIFHEEIEGQWDWTGQRDLRRFVQLCAKHGMYVVPRIGPWSHAEVRNGGFPDWLLTKTPELRSNDPIYLHYVDLYYKQIGEQLKGLMWDEGGPVIGIQLENEYNRRGPLRGADHILKLKELARAAGLRVPFYTVTGWDGAAIPRGEVLPVYGGYPDAPWDASIQPLPPSEVYAFRFSSRVTGNMGAIDTPPTGDAANFTTDTPFITAEMGGGMQVTYHRRPVVSANDIAAMMPVMLGSGVNLYGTYMFHGGENPDGKLTTLQESLATHYPNDLPTKTYDFEAPIGEFGQERPSLLKLKTWNYFLNDFGDILAPMQPHAPSILPASPADLSVPRVSARTSGESGFLFVNNDVRGAAHMPARENFQVTVKLPNSEILPLPDHPIQLPADAYFVWPFNLDLSGLHLRYATAQPFAILGTKDAPIYAFVSQPGIPAEFIIDQAPGLKANGTYGVESSDGFFHVTKLSDHPLDFHLPNGKIVSILLVREEDAEQDWKITSGETTALLETPQQAYIHRDVATVQSFSEQGEFMVRVIPGEIATIRPLPQSNSSDQQPIPNSVAGSHSLSVQLTHPAADPAALSADFKPSSKPRSVAAAPTEAAWSRAGTWTIKLPAFKPNPNQQEFLRVRYTGDVARLSVGGHLLTDDFYTGQPWLIGLDRFKPQIEAAGGKLQLSIYPLRPNPPIFFEPGTPTPPGAHIESVELLTQHSLHLRLTPAKGQ